MLDLLTFHCLRRAHWETLRVCWSYQERDGGLYFHSFSNCGVKGNGAIALKQVCATADAQGVVVTLWTQTPKLVHYYEALGFRLTDIAGGIYNMARAPMSAYTYDEPPLQNISIAA